MTAHALLVVFLQGGHPSALALDLPADAHPGEDEVPMPTKSEAQTFAIEFVTLPAAPAPARTRAQVRSRSEGPAPRRAPARSPVPTKAAQPEQITRATAPTGLLQGPDKRTTTTAPPGRFSLAMRPSNEPGVGGRTGSLIDEVIGSISVPSDSGQSRSDLIATEARIGLDSQATRTTRWRDSGGGSMTSDGEPFTATIASDGTIRFRDHDNVNAELVRWGGIPMPMIAGGFDVTDAAMAAFGDVLYPFRKLKAMDQTREFRAGMAVRARGKSLKSALRRFRKDLRRIWGDSSLGMEERRAIVFALWDECAEEGPEEVLKTAASIRAMVMQFVTRELPPGSTQAFAPEELRALNAQRQSSQLFAPYED